MSFKAHPGSKLLELDRQKASSEADLVQDPSFISEDSTVMGPGATFYSAWFNVANVTVGAGTLSIPYAIQQCGLGLGLMLVVTLACLADASLCLLVRTAEMSGAQNFQGVALQVYGKKCVKFVDLMVGLNCLAVVLAYIIIIGDLLPSLIQEWSGGTEQPSRGLVMGLVVLFFIFPLSLARTMDFLRHTSLIALVCMAYVLCLVVTWAFWSNFDDTANGDIDNDAMVSAEVEWFHWGPRIFFGLPIIGFAFVSHIQVYQIYGELAEKTVEKMEVVVHFSIATCSTLYFLVGIFGYLTFYNALEGNLLNNYTATGSVGVMLAKLGLTITLLFSAPLFMPPLRDITYSFYLTPYEAKRVSTALHVFTTSFILALCFVIALFVPNMADVLALAGSTSSAAIMYFFPALFYLQLAPSQLDADSVGARRWRWVAYLLLACGCLFGVAGTTVTVIDFIEHDPTL